MLQCDGPPPLSGHTLTFRKVGDVEALNMIGGFSPSVGFLDVVWDFNLEKETWNVLPTYGDRPVGKNL